MEAPQLIVLLMSAMAWGIVLVKNGESQGEYNIFNHTLGLAIQLGLLYWGGFFS